MKLTWVLTIPALCTIQAFALDKSLEHASYRNPALCVDERVEDLLSRMTLEEKAGQMFQLQIFMGPNNTFDPGDPSRNRGSTVDRINKKFMTHFNMAFSTVDIKDTVDFVNRLQKLAFETRLGIPVTLSSDPRHAFQDNVSAGLPAGIFSQWPESIGLAAIRDYELIRKFGEIAREEYAAVGLKVSLHPQIDLSTEPRWSRTNHGFGEDATLTSDIVASYIKGFQGDNFGKHSVSTVTKHFPGGGSSMNGEDSHFEYGQNSSYPGNNFEYHLQPFKAAIAAGTRQMMPYYSRSVGLGFDSVGWAFNKQVITELLRDELGEQAQRRAYTLLTNKNSSLPLAPSTDAKFYIEGFNKTYMEGRKLTVVDDVSDADFVLLRLPTPFEPRNGTVDRHFHAGRLDYYPWEQERQAAIYNAVPTVVDILLERPAVIPEVIDGAVAVLGSFGSGPDAFLDIVFGEAQPQGKLPFDLPRSMKAVEDNLGDVPFDTRDPVFKFGHGLSPCNGSSSRSC